VGEVAAIGWPLADRCRTGRGLRGERGRGQEDQEEGANHSGDSTQRSTRCARYGKNGFHVSRIRTSAGTISTLFSPRGLRRPTEILPASRPWPSPPYTGSSIGNGSATCDSE